MTCTQASTLHAESAKRRALVCHLSSTPLRLLLRRAPGLLSSPMSSVATGITGVLLNAVLIVCTTICLHQHAQRRNTTGWTRPLFFLCIWLTAAFDTPRYAVLTSGVEYAPSRSETQKIGYALHLVSSCFFFASFTLIIRLWNQVFSGFELRFLGAHALCAFNVALLIFTVACLASLLSYSGTLDDFFVHSLFTAYSAFDVLKNLAYSLALLYCVERLESYKTIAKSVDGGDEVAKKLRGLAITMRICTACFMVRLGCLVAKQVLLHDAGTNSSGLFSYWWFWVSDFVPRAGPALSFLVLMGIRPWHSAARSQVDAARLRLQSGGASAGDIEKSLSHGTSSGQPSNKISCIHDKDTAGGELMKEKTCGPLVTHLDEGPL
ncbi:hypothetical protein AB1Y20_001228 [Prymnesium parvum]|uniref:THH1/TOM1/TOM3 domain-containing protein n=1 Tax=Prymnesium parvum TaxID=97485 RepID=A0AB34KCS4_PRYPA